MACVPMALGPCSCAKPLLWYRWLAWTVCERSLHCCSGNRMGKWILPRLRRGQGVTQGPWKGRPRGSLSLFHLRNIEIDSRTPRREKEERRALETCESPGHLGTSLLWHFCHPREAGTRSWKDPKRSRPAKGPNTGKVSDLVSRLLLGKQDCTEALWTGRRKSWGEVWGQMLHLV